MVRESYSRDNYEAAQEEHDKESRRHEDFARGSVNAARAGDIKSNSTFYELATEARARRDIAKKRLETLMSEGHAEAAKLNKEYDRLLRKGDEEAIRQFETEKLGMTSGADQAESGTEA